MEQEPAQLTKKERKEQKRAEKANLKAKEQRTRTYKKLALWLVIAAVLGGGAWGLYLLFQQSSEPLSQDYSREVPFEGQAHVEEGARVSYDSNPPASGNHWPAPLSDGIYETEKPDEAIVHSMEHGRVWVSYRPSLPEETKTALAELVKGQGALILAPREANETDIALVAWNRLDAFNVDENGSFDEARVRDFIKRYRFKGPEFIPVGQGGGKTYEDY